ncbi:MAG: M15 family metallopeptidase [Acidimicrobiia bacterium]|nr:M15 family metallopeptidase [Acidimicrobiia bacterium]
MRFYPFLALVRPRIAVAVIVVLLLSASSFPSEAGLAEELEDLRSEQEDVKARKQDQARDVDVATAEADELTAALEVLNAEVNEQATKVAAAEQRLAAAEARHAVAIEAVALKTAEIADLEARLGDRAISSFVTGTPGRSPMLEEVDPNRAVRMQSLVEAVTEDGISVADELRVAREDLEIEQAEADDAAAEAEEIRAQLADDLAELERRRNEQADLVNAAEERLERELAEAWALSELDKELSAKILEKNKELEAQLAAAAARRQNNPVPSTSGASFPSSSDIVNVGGIWVHRDIADNLRRLLDHAASEGHNFSGGGYRDSASQIRLRRAHCGTSNYAIYHMPSSQCRPPTARPGASQHEQGKAIDFRYNGRTISSRSNAGYLWLRSNAASYGLYNLPSEPWHWSVNGR